MVMNPYRPIKKKSTKLIIIVTTTIIIVIIKVHFQVRKLTPVLKIIIKALEVIRISLLALYRKATNERNVILVRVITVRVSVEAGNILIAHLTAIEIRIIQTNRNIGTLGRIHPAILDRGHDHGQCPTKDMVLTEVDVTPTVVIRKTTIVTGAGVQHHALAAGTDLELVPARTVILEDTDPIPVNTGHTLAAVAGQEVDLSHGVALAHIPTRDHTPNLPPTRGRGRGHGHTISLIQSRAHPTNLNQITDTKVVQNLDTVLLTQPRNILKVFRVKRMTMIKVVSLILLKFQCLVISKTVEVTNWRKVKGKVLQEKVPKQAHLSVKLALQQLVSLATLTQPGSRATALNRNQAVVA